MRQGRVPQTREKEGGSAWAGRTGPPGIRAGRSAGRLRARQARSFPRRAAGQGAGRSALPRAGAEPLVPAGAVSPRPRGWGRLRASEKGRGGKFGFVAGRPDGNVRARVCSPESLGKHASSLEVRPRPPRRTARPRPAPAPVAREAPPTATAAGLRGWGSGHRGPLLPRLLEPATSPPSSDRCSAPALAPSPLLLPRETQRPLHRAAFLSDTCHAPHRGPTPQRAG